MEDSHRLTLLFLLTIIVTLFESNETFAQKKLEWHANFGVGMTDMRDFNASFGNISFTEINDGTFFPMGWKVSRTI